MQLLTYGRTLALPYVQSFAALPVQPAYPWLPMGVLYGEEL